MRNDDKKLVGNANNEPSEDSVTKIQKAALWFKPRLDSPLHWSKTSKPVLDPASTPYTVMPPCFPSHSSPLVLLLCGGKLHQVGQEMLPEAR